MKRFMIIVFACVLSGCASGRANKSGTEQAAGEKQMRLGNFSMSLAVKDLAASRAFYEKLGFRAVGGNGRNFSIMQNETSTIGLFQSEEHTSELQSHSFIS